MSGYGDFRDDSLQSGNPVDKRPVQDSNGPPPTEQKPEESHLPQGKPRNMDAPWSNLSGEQREYFEKLVADKQNNERAAKQYSERLAKTEAKLNEIAQREAEAERKRLEESGQYKELAEKAKQELEQFKRESRQRELQDKVSRELMKAGAVDEEMISAGLMAQYGGELTVENVPTLIEQLRQNRPLLFKSEQNTQPQAPLPQVRSSGLSTPTPQSGNAPSSFDARDKSHSLEDVQKHFKSATKDAKWF